MGTGIFEYACEGADKDDFRLASFFPRVNFKTITQRADDLHGARACGVVGQQSPAFGYLAPVDLHLVRVTADLLPFSDLLQLSRQNRQFQGVTRYFSPVFIAR